MSHNATRALDGVGIPRRLHDHWYGALGVVVALALCRITASYYNFRWSSLVGRLFVHVARLLSDISHRMTRITKAFA